MTKTTTLTIEQLRDAVVGGAAAVRLRVRLQPAGGAGTKVFPPTYQGGVYAVEKRHSQGNDEKAREVSCVLLDSVQSQANRLEQALLEAYRANRLAFPLLSVDFSNDLPDIGEITALDAPHRIADAIFRDSILNGKPFRPQPKAGGKRDTATVSDEGKRFAEATVRNATPLFELCPTALIFGVWDSTGAAGGLGNKFARAIVSEIVGMDAVFGVRTGSRLDPLAIEKGEIYEGPEGDWVVHTDEARQVTVTVKENGEEKAVEEPVVFKRKASDRGRPSEINHSNIPPDYARYDWPGQEQELKVEDPLRPGQNVRKGNIKVGGVTIDHAEQTTVLSLAALRRLRFPIDGKPSTEADHAARTVLAALALAAIAHQMDPPDYFLRSNCQLVLENVPAFELVRTASDFTPFSLTADDADALFAEAVRQAKEFRLPWREAKVVLQPKKALVDLVKRSRELGGDSGD
jgi:CRISPR-associated protein Csb1